MQPFTAERLAEIVLGDDWTDKHSSATTQSEAVQSDASPVDIKSVEPNRRSLDVDHGNSPTNSRATPGSSRPLRSYAVEFRIEYDALDIRDKIGDGGYGSVFKAVWKTGHVFCAVKMLKGTVDSGSDESSHDSDEDDRTDLASGSPRDDFERETALLRELHHPNLVVCYGMCPGGPGVP